MGARLLLGFLLVGAWPALSWGLSQTLAWDYVQGSQSAVGFNIYRAATCNGPWTKLNTTPLPLTPLTYTDSTVQAGQAYCWIVRATDGQGTESGPSNPLAFQVPGVLNAPTNLRPAGTTVP